MATTQTKKSNGFNPADIANEIALFGVKTVNRGVKSVNDFVGDIDAKPVVDRIHKTRLDLSRQVRKVSKAVDTQAGDLSEAVDKLRERVGL